MDDKLIVELYWQRSENAISETETKYGAYCRTVAMNILGDPEDAAESVNDTWFDAWNSMPPHRPTVLSTFLGKITRRISVDKWRRNNSAKRGSGEMALVLEELEHCVVSEHSVETELQRREFAKTVNTFISQLPETERKIFLCRYWYVDSVSDIAKNFSFTESKVKSMLFRTREKFKNYLIKEGHL